MRDPCSRTRTQSNRVESGRTKSNKVELQPFISVRLCDCVRPGSTVFTSKVEPKSKMVKIIDIEQGRTQSNTVKHSWTQSNTVEHSHKVELQQIFLVRLCLTLFDLIRLCSTVFDCVLVRLQGSSFLVKIAGKKNNLICLVIIMFHYCGEKNNAKHGKN